MLVLILGYALDYYSACFILLTKIAQNWSIQIPCHFEYVYELSKNIKMKIAVSTTHKVVNILAIKKCNLMSTCLN